MDRTTRRRVGRAIRAMAEDEIDKFRVGFCVLVYRARRKGLVHYDEEAAFLRAVDEAIHVYGIVGGYAYLPSALMGTCITAVPPRVQHAIRSSWLRHWEETGVGLNRETWKARAAERKAAALARKSAKETNVGGAVNTA